MTEQNENILSNKIAQVCFDHYLQLEQRGKPLPLTEWTLLAAVVQSVDGNLSVVALATGTKCIGQNAMSFHGDVVNDSHAEVLARRCFLRYLYEQVEQTKTKGSSEIFSGCTDDGKCLLRPNIHFSLFTSHVPCGDAAIIPTTLESRKRKCSPQGNSEPKSKKTHKENTKSDFDINSGGANLVNDNNTIEELVNDTDLILNNDVSDVDVHRTGAKCIGGNQDCRLPGIGYHILGAVRTKPGRGDKTLSLSCSDKIARWIAIGFEGALLSLLVEGPIWLKYIVIAAGGPYSDTSLHRALVARLHPANPPRFLQSTLEFVHSRYKANAEAKPCPTCIMWAKVCYKPLEIGVDGRQQGTTKKNLDKGRLMISKSELHLKFISLTGSRYAGLNYREVKNMAVDYQMNWKRSKDKLGGVWTEKLPALTEFINEKVDERLERT